jgi:hypothetical protein
MAGSVVVGGLWLAVPAEEKALDAGGQLDLVGAYLGVGGLILFNFVWK